MGTSHKAVVFVEVSGRGTVTKGSTMEADWQLQIARWVTHVASRD